jgi:hypothetical protein
VTVFEELFETIARAPSEVMATPKGLENPVIAVAATQTEPFQSSGTTVFPL